jgi:hypothetical protein
MVFAGWGDMGLGSLQAGVGTALDAFKEASRQRQLEALGKQIQSGDIMGAAGTALQSGDLNTGLKLYQMQQEQEGLAKARDVLNPNPIPGSSPTVASSGFTPPDPNAFASAHADDALEASKKTGVDPRIIVAQAAVESQYGSAAPGNNLFGIKSQQGNTLPTTEVVNGQPVRTMATFASYPSTSDAFSGYADFINSNPRYAALKSAKTLDDQINALHKSGYATDPDYGWKIKQVASRIDPSVFAPKPPADDGEGGGALPVIPAAFGGVGGGAKAAVTSPVSDAGVIRTSSDQAAIDAKKAELNRFITAQGGLTKGQLESGFGQALKTKVEVIKQELKDLNDKTSWHEATPQEVKEHGIDTSTPRPWLINDKGDIKFPNKSQVSIDQKGESAESVKSGQEAATRKNLLLSAADSAPDEIGRLKLLNTVLQNTRTGPIAGPEGTVVAVGRALGLADDTIKNLGLDPNQPVNNETANKLASELVTGSIGAKNGGFPASNFSVAERQFLEKMFPNIQAQGGSNQFVTDVLIAKKQKILDMTNEWDKFATAQEDAGKPASFEKFERIYRKEHSNDNIFQPVIENYRAGGYTKTAPQMGGMGIGSQGPQPQPTVPPNPNARVVPGSPPTNLPKVDPAAALAEARQAIARGMPKTEAIRRLQGAGVDPSGL